METGVVSVTSNIIPGLFSSLMESRDDEQNEKLQELIGWLFCEPNPIPINTAMAMCGWSSLYSASHMFPCPKSSGRKAQSCYELSLMTSQGVRISKSWKIRILPSWLHTDQSWLKRAQIFAS
eukprot:jgi/Picre1/35116/NNA_002579.t1